MLGEKGRINPVSTVCYRRVFLRTPCRVYLVNPLQSGKNHISHRTSTSSNVFNNILPANLCSVVSRFRCTLLLHLSGPGQAIVRCLRLSGQQLSKEMTFDQDTKHSGSS